MTTGPGRLIRSSASIDHCPSVIPTNPNLGLAANFPLPEAFRASSPIKYLKSKILAVCLEIGGSVRRPIRQAPISERHELMLSSWLTSRSGVPVCALTRSPASIFSSSNGDHEDRIFGVFFENLAAAIFPA